MRPVPTAVGVGPGLEQQQRRDAGPQTDRGHARKAELLEAARRVFERQGFLDARVADIAEEAGVSQGTFYTYYDSKDAIFREVAAELATRMIDALRPEGSRPATVHEQIELAMRRFVAAYRAESRLIEVVAQLGQTTPEVAALRLSVREAFVARTARGIRVQQSQGLIDPALDPWLASEVLGSMVDHTCWVWLTLGKDFDEEAVIATMTLVWARAIGLREPEPARETGQA